MLIAPYGLRAKESIKMNLQNEFSPSLIKKIGYYVYLYSHPKTNEVFYVGKGKGNRAFSHLFDAAESEKSKFIAELRKQNLEPKIEILIHGLESDTALKVESSVIDLLGIKNLTNIQLGYKSAEFGRMSPQQLSSIYSADKITIDVPAMLIRINQLFRHNMSPMELYDVTRSSWRVNLENAQKSKYAFAIYQGVIQEVYEILGWYKGGTTLSSRTKFHDYSMDNDEMTLKQERYEFIGNIADKEIREKYLLKAISDDVFKPGNSNPIMYMNHEK